MKDAIIRALPAAVKDQRRWITPEPLGVAPQWVGAPLATPARRSAAMLIDLGIVALLSGVSGLWLLGGLVAVLLQLNSRRGQVTRKRQVVGWLVAGLLAMLAFQEAVSVWQDWQRPSAEKRVSRAARQAPPATPVDHSASAASAASDASDASSASSASSASAPSDAERVAQLEAQVRSLQRAARGPKSVPLKEQLGRFLDDIGAGLGWGVVYFSLLPAWWGGQTVGKKLLRLRVIELTGQPMTVMRCLKRYGGYAAGVATGGIGFAQALWDPNRQGLHDKAAHTAVIDLRAPTLASEKEVA